MIQECKVFKYENSCKRVRKLDVYSQFYDLKLDKGISPFSTIYFRFPGSNYGFLKLLKFLKNKLHCTIIIEIPTYPYRQEIKCLPTRIQTYLSLQDIICWKFARYYVDKIVTYSEHKYIHGVETIGINNGIDIFTISPKEKIDFNKQLQVIAVASIKFWHGYDRFIEGMKIYYEKDRSIKVIFNIVGDGPELESLKELVAKYNLQKFVVFHGPKFANDLDTIFNSSHVALGTLGLHRIHLFQASPLKSREYCARGIPFIQSGDSKDIPNDFKYVHYVPQNDSPIIIEDLINFYSNIVGNFPNYNREIRDFAEKNLTWIKKMQPIVEYIESVERSDTARICEVKTHN